MPRIAIAALMLCLSALFLGIGAGFAVSCRKKDRAAFSRFAAAAFKGMDARTLAAVRAYRLSFCSFIAPALTCFPVFLWWMMWIGFDAAPDAAFRGYWLAKLENPDLPPRASLTAWENAVFHALFAALFFADAAMFAAPLARMALLRRKAARLGFALRPNPAALDFLRVAMYVADERVRAKPRSFLGDLKDLRAAAERSGRLTGRNAAMLLRASNNSIGLFHAYFCAHVKGYLTSPENAWGGSVVPTRPMRRFMSFALDAQGGEPTPLTPEETLGAVASFWGAVSLGEPVAN